MPTLQSPGVVFLSISRMDVSLVAHPRPAPPPPFITHLKTSTRYHRILYTSAIILGLQHQPDDVTFMTSSVKNLNNELYSSVDFSYRNM